MDAVEKFISYLSDPVLILFFTWIFGFIIGWAFSIVFDFLGCMAGDFFYSKEIKKIVKKKLDIIDVTQSQDPGAGAAG